MYDMCSVAPTVSKILGIRPPMSSESSHLPNVIDTMVPTDKLAVIVVDAFGISTWNNSREYTPTINKLETLHGIVIHSVMKTITPINFATMLTGASPETHGITSREMPLKHETIFDSMREYRMRSATAARALSSLGVLISPHADKPGIAGSNLDSEVTEITVSNLRDGFNLVWVQLLDVDDAGHAFGPYSDESKAAVAGADKNLRVILEAAVEEGYSVMVLADHGQHDSNDETYKGTHGTDMPEDVEVPFLWANHNELHEILNLKP